MAAKSFGNFGTFKINYKNECEAGNPIPIEMLSKSTLRDIEYFYQDSSEPDCKQIVNYTWEKPLPDSPSIFKPHPEDERDADIKKYQNTLDLMAPYRGFAHAVKQNKWEGEPSEIPTFRDHPQKRRTNVLSSMTQYVEEMNKAFPGGQ